MLKPTATSARSEGAAIMTTWETPLYRHLGGNCRVPRHNRTVTEPEAGDYFRSTPDLALPHRQQ
jgi:hypothetical protein